MVQVALCAFGLHQFKFVPVVRMYFVVTLKKSPSLVRESKHLDVWEVNCASAKGHFEIGDRRSISLAQRTSMRVLLEAAEELPLKFSPFDRYLVGGRGGKISMDKFWGRESRPLQGKIFCEKREPFFCWKTVHAGI